MSERNMFYTTKEKTTLIYIWQDIWVGGSPGAYILTLYKECTLIHPTLSRTGNAYPQMKLLNVCQNIKLVVQTIRQFYEDRETDGFS